MTTERKDRGVNFNTIWITMLLAIVGYLARTEFEEIKSSQAKLWSAIMPRQEIEVRIEALKSENNDIRARLTQLEAQLNKQRP